MLGKRRPGKREQVPKGKGNHPGIHGLKTTILGENRKMGMS
jgi:hypothetical protein